MELVYHDEVLKTMLTETKTMLLFLSPFWTVLVHGTGYRSVQRLRQFLKFFSSPSDQRSKFICKTAPKSLLWVPTGVPGFEYTP